MALGRAQLHPHEASDQWFLDHFRSAASRERGDYAECLERWWSVFPREQLLVLLHDDIAEAPLLVLEALASHLHVDAADFARLPADDLAQVVVPAVAPGDAAPAAGPKPARPSLVPALCEQYGPQIERLGRLLGRDLGFWTERFAANRRGPSQERVEVRVGGAGMRKVGDLMAAQGRSR